MLFLSIIDRSVTPAAITPNVERSMVREFEQATRLDSCRSLRSFKYIVNSAITAMEKLHTKLRTNHTYIANVTTNRRGTYQ